jgi:hypothetical protein
MDTLVLSQDLWDLVIDADGNIAVASDPYAPAQDVASAARLFLGECWYETTLGIPYWQSILGNLPPIALMKAQLASAALTVPGVTNPQVFLTSVQNRVITGQIVFTDSNGVTSATSVGGPATILTEFAITDTGAPGVTDGGFNVVVG